MIERTSLKVPGNFCFLHTVKSHGWYQLAPFEYCEEEGTLATTLDLGESVERVRMGSDQPTKLGAPIWLERRKGQSAEIQAQVEQRVATALNLELDLTPFYELTDELPEFRWVRAGGFGRLLRAPTPFEDVVKLILTTNCSWAFTRQMARYLVGYAGRSAASGELAFPTAGRLGRIRESTYRKKLKVGYRAPSLLKLGRAVGRGEVQPEHWSKEVLENTAEFRKRLLQLPGVGPYVADNVCRLLGHPDGLGLDSWLRSECARIYHGGRPVKDRTIERRYKRFGRWAGLALWCDATRDWFDGVPAR